MATNFPTSVDNFTNPTANDSLNLPSHSTQHANANDAIEAVEDYLLNGNGRAGLQLINATTVSSQASVTISNVFSATYDAYRVVLSNISMSAANNLIARLGANASGYYFCELSGSGNYVGTTVSAGQGANANQYSTGIVTDSTARTGGWIELQNVFQAEATAFQSQGSDTRTSGSGTRIVSGFHNSATSFTSLYIAVSSGTFSGSIKIYGYRNS